MVIYFQLLIEHVSLIPHRLIRDSGRNGFGVEPLPSQAARPFVKSNSAKHHTQSNFREGPERPRRLNRSRDHYEQTIAALAQRTRHFSVAGSRPAWPALP